MDTSISYSASVFIVSSRVRYINVDINSNRSWDPAIMGPRAPPHIYQIRNLVSFSYYRLVFRNCLFCNNINFFSQFILLIATILNLSHVAYSNVGQVVFEAGYQVRKTPCRNTSRYVWMERDNHFLLKNSKPKIGKRK